MIDVSPLYGRHRSPPEIISRAGWLYHRFCLSFRDAEDLRAERRVIVSYKTVRYWARSSDLTTRPTTAAAQSEGFSLSTFKVRERVPAALRALEKQDREFTGCDWVSRRFS